MSEYIVSGPFEHDDAFVANMGAERTHLYGYELREEIVRCRDCVHIHTVRNWTGVDVDECWLHADRESGALGKERTEPNGFCAWGERRNG